VFNAFHAFSSNFSKSKDYWRIIFCKMDLWMKKRSFRRWRAGGNIKHTQMLQQLQNEESKRQDELVQVLRRVQEKKIAQML